ncbi:MAG TPA: HAD hydrolase-like protein [Anaerolineales bacterium]|nr:HAD hydrolase-like protein [Anaerolineales bacterium]
MTEKPLQYPTVLFDWGDTVMRDDPASTVPMVEWQTIELIEGITDVLEYLHSSWRRIVLATSASISDEGQIRGALARTELDGYFSHIYCFKNTYLPKGEAFYRHILSDLRIPAAEALMVGDGFEKDVQAANAAGISAVWFNPHSDEACQGELHTTVHSMQELRVFFKSFDQQ